MENEKYVGQRGPDKEPREFNSKSLLNLKQFQKPVSEVDLRVNAGTNWIKVGLIAIFLVGIGLLIWKIRKKKQNNDSK